MLVVLRGAVASHQRPSNHLSAIILAITTEVWVQVAFEKVSGCIFGTCRITFLQTIIDGASSSHVLNGLSCRVDLVIVLDARKSQKFTSIFIIHQAKVPRLQMN